MRRLAPILILALGFAGLSGCARDPVKPGSATLGGEVRDASGQPVAGAEVSLSFAFAASARPATGARAPRLHDTPVPTPPPGRSFFVINNPCSTGALELRLSTPNSSQGRLTVVDRKGTTRRVLADRAFVAGVHILVWDGRDDADQSLPPDLYRVTWHDVEGDSVFDFAAAVLWEATEPDHGVNVTTSTNGRFAIPLEDLPIGLGLESVDLEGNDLGVVVIRPMISLVVRGDVAGSPRVAHVTGVDLGDLRHDVAVTIALP